jgi:hypothetical protein
VAGDTVFFWYLSSNGSKKKQEKNQINRVINDVTTRTELLFMWQGSSEHMVLERAKRVAGRIVTPRTAASIPSSTAFKRSHRGALRVNLIDLGQSSR